MNYYEHHIGDYAEATSHLSFVEDAAYARCIRKYYSSEQPLPPDIKAVQRLVGARTREERQAVETVLKEFFDLRQDGWHNRRCDEELGRYLSKRDSAKRSAAARWNNGHANAGNSDMRSLSERNANASKTHDVRNALQAPSAKRQSPGTKLSESDSDTGTTKHTHTSAHPTSDACARARECADDFSAETDNAETLTAAGLDPSHADAYLEAWDSEGFSTERLLTAIAIARKRKKTNTVPAKYVDAVVRDEGNFPHAKRAKPGNGGNGNGAHHDTADELEDRIIEEAIHRGLTDAEIVRIPDLQLAPNLHSRISAKRQELTHAEH